MNLACIPSLSFIIIQRHCPHGAKTLGHVQVEKFYDVFTGEPNQSHIRILGGGSRDWFEHDSDLNPLRSHPRFQRMMARLAGGGDEVAENSG